LFAALAIIGLVADILWKEQQGKEMNEELQQTS
jgi:hypothetical protein